MKMKPSIWTTLDETPAIKQHPHFRISSSALTNLRASLSSFLLSSFVAEESSSRLILPANEKHHSLARARSALGRFVVWGSANLVTSIRFSDQVTSQVFAAVLNESQLVDFPLVTHADEDCHFFVKNPIWRSSDDLVQLRRLGPDKVNLTTHESMTTDDGGRSTKILDVKVHLERSVINIRYGTSAVAEKKRLLRHSLKLGTRRAWAKERQALAEGKQQQPWTSDEVERIHGQGFLSSYEVIFTQDVDLYPELANDMDNLMFRKKKV